MEYLGRAPEKTIEEAALFIQNIHDLQKKGESILWGITFKSNTKLIGTICYWHITP
jgi:RimJ/RimL family protein N-acetyltransferase